MSIETEQLQSENASSGDDARDSARGAQVVGGLPAPLVMNQRCAAELRAYLADAKLAHYLIFYSPSGELYDIERTAESLGEVCAWETLPSLVTGGESIHTTTHDRDATKFWESGVFRLQQHEVVLARWYWITEEGLRVFWLCAAPSVAKFHELKMTVRAKAREKRLRSWQIVRGYSYRDEEMIAREAPMELYLDESLRQRVEMEIIGFFSDAVAALYRGLKVPYRRGVLLHGPPGNGKTSLIRHIGSRVMNVSAMILRTTEKFDSDDLEEVVRRWKRSAPAMLVIEDLNWLIKQVNVSMFLNLLDGVDASTNDGGLLLIATSNHPEQLDSAINNRPGRFDVVIEMPGPDFSLRRAFLAARLTDMDAELIDRAARETDGLSFAHLQEILRLSGLSAIHAGRAVRTAGDVMKAVVSVCDSREEAVRGFPKKAEIPFGLLPLMERRKQRAAAK